MFKVTTMFKVMVVGLGVLGGWVACGGAGGGNLREGTLQLREGQSLDDNPECGVNGPSCPEGLTCASFALGNGPQVRCVDTAVICDKLQCTTGQCAILESYPVQVRCSGKASGPDANTPVSNQP